MKRTYLYRVEIAGTLRFIEYNFIKSGEVDNLPHGWLRYTDGGEFRGGGGGDTSRACKK